MKAVKTCRSSLYLTAAFLLLFLNGSFTFSHAGDVVVTLDRSDRDRVDCATTEDPVEQSYILTAVPGAIATLVLFPGGAGKLDVADWRLSINAANFLVRSRHLFASFGFNVAVMDAATDFLSCPFGLRGRRLSEAHVSDIQAVIQDLRGQYSGLQVWVVGTSRGTISAAQAAAELPAESGGPDGLVLTSSVTRSGSPPSNLICEVALETITVPTLIVTHKQDECPVTPPEDTKAIKDRLISAPRVHTRYFSGGFDPLSPPCEALSYHGYFGIEPRVVGRIAKWIEKQIKEYAE